MNNNPKNVSVPVIVILYLFAAVFLVYAIYMAYDAVIYVNTYDTNAAVSATNMLQYVVAASASYFGFAIVIFAAASILGALNKVQRNLYHASVETAVNAAVSDAAAEESETAFVADDESDAVKKNAEVPQPAQSNDEETVPEDEAKAPETDSTINSDETPAELYAETRETPPVAEQEHNTESRPSAQPIPEPKAEDKQEENSAPLVENFTSQFITKTENKPAPESAVKPQMPEIIAQQQATPEIVAQQQPTPEIVIKKHPVTEAVPQESVPRRQAAPDTSAEKPAVKPQPTTVPEEILQTKRKRGLKYETVAMDGRQPDAEYPQNLSDTIRLKKEDRDAISSAFIRDIFEKNE